MSKTKEYSSDVQQKIELHKFPVFILLL